MYIALYRLSLYIYICIYIIFEDFILFHLFSKSKYAWLLVCSFSFRCSPFTAKIYLPNTYMCSPISLKPFSPLTLQLSTGVAVVHDPRDTYDFFFTKLVPENINNQGFVTAVINFVAKNLEEIAERTDILTDYFPSLFKVAFCFIFTYNNPTFATKCIM